MRAVALHERFPSLHLLSLGPAEAGDDLLALVASYEPQPLQAPAVQPDDVAGLAYTGGTTGKPKGVMGTCRSGAMMTMIQLTAQQRRDEERRARVAERRIPLSPLGKPDKLALRATYWGDASRQVH